MAYPSHSPELSDPMHRICHYKESRDLLTQVESEGEITIKTAKLGRNASYAMWMPGERVIYLNTSIQRTEGSLIRSIVFELHNALTNKEFYHYDQLVYQGKISREKYIEAIEKIEYDNARKTVALLQKGVRNGAFPVETYWNLPSTFAEHLHIQHQTGHATAIGYVYDSLNHTRKNRESRTIARKW